MTKQSIKNKQMRILKQIRKIQRRIIGLGLALTTFFFYFGFSTKEAIYFILWAIVVIVLIVLEIRMVSEKIKSVTHPTELKLLKEKLYWFGSTIAKVADDFGTDNDFLSSEGLSTLIWCMSSKRRNLAFSELLSRFNSSQPPIYFEGLFIPPNLSISDHGKLETRFEVYLVRANANALINCFEPYTDTYFQKEVRKELIRREKNRGLGGGCVRALADKLLTIENNSTCKERKASIENFICDLTNASALRSGKENSADYMLYLTKTFEQWNKN